MGEAAGGGFLGLEHVPGDLVEFVRLGLDPADAVASVGERAGGATAGQQEKGSQDKRELARQIARLLFNEIISDAQAAVGGVEKRAGELDHIVVETEELDQLLA